MSVGYRYSELILFKLECAAPKCRQAFQEVIGQLAGKASIPCPICGAPVDLVSHKRAIDDLMRVAAELDKPPQ